MKGLRILALILLFFNAISATFGGTGLVLSPDGSLMRIPLEWLEPTPFKDYLIPGLILLSMNGILSFIIGLMVIFKKHGYQLFVILQGAILAGWIITQILLIDLFHWLHILYGSTGILLIINGFVLRSRLRSNIQL